MSRTSYTANPSTGIDGATSFPTDLVGGVEFPITKLAHGDNATATDVTDSTPLPVGIKGEGVEVLEGIERYLQMIALSLGLPTVLGQLRVSVDAGTLPTVTTVTTVSTVTTCSTVTSLTNQAQVGGYNAQDQIPSLMNMNAAQLRSQIVVS